MPHKIISFLTLCQESSENTDSVRNIHTFGVEMLPQNIL